MDQDIVAKTFYSITENLRSRVFTKLNEAIETKTAYLWAYTEELKL